METFFALAIVAITQLAAAASPGPTFVVVSSHSAQVSRCAGLMTAFGSLTATAIWAVLAAAGLGAVLVRHPEAYRAIQYVGAGYLIFLGIRMIVSAMRNPAQANAACAAGMSFLGCFQAGFLTNISNPKTIGYYVSLFAVAIPAEGGPVMVTVAVVVALLVSTFWWVLVTVAFSAGRVRSAYCRLRRGIDAACGCILLALGCRLALSR